MKALKKLGLLGLCAVILASCGDDDPVQPTDSDNYFPTAPGHYRTYDNYTIDEESNEKTMSGRDSVVAGETAMKDGKNATEYTSFEWNAEGGSYVAPGTKQYYAFESNGKLYAYSDMLGRMLDLGGEDSPLDIPLDLPDQWILLADANATGNWPILTHVIPEFEQDFGITTAKVNLTLTITGMKAVKENVTVGSQVFQGAKKFVTTFRMTGTAKANGLPLTVPIDFGTTVDTWYVKDIGMVKSYMAPFKIELEGFDEFSIDGRESLIINYKGMAIVEEESAE